MDKKIIKRKALAGIMEGKPKQKVYDELVEEFGNRIYIADIVRFIPEKRKCLLFRILNYSFLVFLLLSAAVIVRETPNWIEGMLFLLTWFIPMIIIVALQMVKFYSVIAFFGTIMFTTTLVIAFYESFQELMVLSLIASVIYFLFGIFIPNWFTPSYQKTHKKFTNKNGQTRMKLIHKFN
jgi:hypothetical protein